MSIEEFSPGLGQMSVYAVTSRLHMCMTVILLVRHVE